MSHHDDNPEKMARMRDWLEIAAREVDVDPSVLTDVEQPLLDMVSVISHGPVSYTHLTLPTKRIV